MLHTTPTTNFPTKSLRWSSLVTSKSVLSFQVMKETMSSCALDFTTALATLVPPCYVHVFHICVLVSRIRHSRLKNFQPYIAIKGHL